MLNVSPIGLSEYEHRFAEYEYDFARSINARCGIGKATAPTKTTGFGHHFRSQVGSLLGRPESRVNGRPLRCPDSHARNVARSKSCGVPCGRVSWRCGSRTPGEPECRFKQHDSGTIGCTGDLGVLGSEPRLNGAVPVIRSVRRVTGGWIRSWGRLGLTIRRRDWLRLIGVVQ